MTLALDAPPLPDSPLRRLDPRWKLAALVPAALVCATLRTVPASALALALALALAALGRLPPRWYLARLGTAALVLVLFAAPLPFLARSDGPGWRLGPVTVSPAGVGLAVALWCKALAVVGLMLALLATTPLPEALKAAHALRVPGLLVHLVALTHRYAFVLAGELARLRVALRVRGYRNRATRHCYRTVGHVAATLLVRGSERAERVSQALRCRGFDGRFRSLAAFRTTAADVLFFLLVTGGAAGLLVGDLLRR